MRQKIDALGIKGSVLVIKNGKTLLDYATENTTDTSYLINSVQKSMTAAMVMHEVQKGKLSLHDHLSKFYPEIPGAKKITIKNLLTMTAGLDLKPGAQLGRKHFISDDDNINYDAARTIFTSKLLGQWHYSSLNYIYLCGIMSQITGKSYEQLFRESYIKPLQLKHTAFLWSKSEKIIGSGLVPGMIYRRGRYIAVKHKAALRDAHNELGAGSVVMSNEDIAKVMHYILAGKILTTASRKLLYEAGPPVYYNGGLYNNIKYNVKTANGAGEGYYTFMRTTDNGKTMMIIQSNQTRAGQFVILKAEINQIMGRLIGLKSGSENITG
ncbi:serine hydrolase [Lactobacillus sp. ESL0731]|uniref:serine hydrolase domain-containing protein n=1 Tax=unclassified Lactobacillus TaxID=2620435 RepID=UPI0023F858B6|nr:MULTISPECIES: serine hydrolase domain-containing protein [unclassified Lactobacillus]WEV51111.1 serine hydrolase [Lactobacillus sp. ESL0700]WEV62240.1 serine hydrolase [Lactobacillus sp. ESL0731]